MDYRFLGAESEIGDVRLDRLGQKITLSEQEGLMAMNGGCAILPASEYGKLGITADEEKAYSYAAYRQNAPDALKSKIAAGLRRYQIIVDEAAMGIDVENVKPPGAAPPVPVKQTVGAMVSEEKK